MNQIIEHGIYQFGERVDFVKFQNLVRKREKSPMNKLTNEETKHEKHLTLKMEFIKLQASLLICADSIWTLVCLIEIFSRLFQRKLCCVK